jgi:polysaccharide biosynthesis transport protein
MASQRDDETQPEGDALFPPRSRALSVPMGKHFADEPLPAEGVPAYLAAGSLWLALRRRWLLALTIGLLLGSAAAATVWFLRPAKYTAFAFVKIDAERPELLPRGPMVSDLELYRMTQTALIKSPKVIEAALREDKVRQLSLVANESDPVAWLESALVVEPLRNSDLLKVSLSCGSADDAADLVNAIVRAYLQETLNREQKQRTVRLKDLKEVCEKSEAKLRAQRQQLQGLTDSLKSKDPDTISLRQKIALEEYLALRKELIVLGSELRQAARNRDGGTRPAAAVEPALSEVVIEQTLDEHPEVVAEAKKVAKAEEVLAQLKANARPGYHGIAEAEEEVSTAKTALAALRTKLRRGLEAKLRQRGEAEAQLANAKQTEREALMKEQFDAMLKEVEERRKTAGQIGRAAVPYETELSEIEQADKVIKSLWAERERLEAEGHSNAQRITVELEATPPRIKNRKPQILAAGLAGFVGFLVGAFGIALLDYRTGRIYSRDEVVGGLRLRVLGSLPVRRAQPSVAQAGRQLKYAYGEHQWKEALNGLRTVLLHEVGQHGLKVVQVTSAAPQEGKTTLASHLAISLAAAGRRTLLIDADLRRPVLHDLFAVSQAPGLSEVLREDATSVPAITPTSVPGLDLLPAGFLDDAVLHLLARGRLEEILTVLRSQYDAIVIDSSPIMAVHDALLVGHHVDAVLLSIRPSQSRMPIVGEACERLRSLHIPVLGTVLNGLHGGSRDLLSRYLSPTASPGTMLLTAKAGGRTKG